MKNIQYFCDRCNKDITRKVELNMHSSMCVKAAAFGEIREDLNLYHVCKTCADGVRDFMQNKLGDKKEIDVVDPDERLKEVNIYQDGFGPQLDFEDEENCKDGCDFVPDDEGGTCSRCGTIALF